MPQKLSSRLRAKAREAKRSIEVENKEMAERMRGHALKLVSGQIPKAQIDAARPFAKNRPADIAITAITRGRSRPNSRKKVRVTSRGVFPLNPINSHSGKLERSLRMMRTRNGGYRLFFTASYAKFVTRKGGTKFMEDRELWKQMQRYLAYEKKRAKARVRRSLQRP